MKELNWEVRFYLREIDEQQGRGVGRRKDTMKLDSENNRRNVFFLN